ncbi:MAG: ribonuclease Y, partial [Parcubacteria group bacterium]|nr:ribonuclease Y [Parcubacteria group bacterium]
MTYAIYVILLAGGFFAGYFVRKSRALAHVSSAEARAEKILTETKAKQKELLLDA